MSLNTRVALLLLVALVGAPLWLPLTPLVWIWLRRERAAARIAGMTTLLPHQGRALAAFAEASLVDAPAEGWQSVAANVDDYLSAVRSPRHWRTGMMLTLLEFGPCLRLRRPLSRQPLAARRQWVERYYSTTRGLFAVPSLARQLVRMGYYASPSIARSLGFRTMRERVRRSVAVGSQVVG